MKNREISKATINAVATGLLGQFVTIFSGIIVARSLGAEGRGYLALLILFPIIITSIGTFGLPYAVTYFVAKGKLSKKVIDSLLRQFIPLQLMLFVIAHYVLLSFYLEDKDDIYSSAILTLCLTPMLLLQQYGMSFIQGLNRFGLFNILRLLVPVLYTLMVLVAWVFDSADLFTIIFMWVAANILAVFIILNKVTNVFRGECLVISDKLTVKEFYTFGLKGMFGAMTPLESFRLDHILAGIFLSPAMLGLYVVGQAFSNIPAFVSRSASMVAFPIISNKSKATGLKFVWKYFGAISALNVVMSIALVFALPYILPFMFGSEFEDAVILAQILLFGVTMSASRRILVEGLRGLGLPHISTLAEFSMYPWLLTGGVYLTVHYFEVGLASAVSISFAISLVVSILYGLRVNHQFVKL